MKNFYALIVFDGVYVSGFLAIGHKDSESARLSIIEILNKDLKVSKEKESPNCNLQAYLDCFVKCEETSKRGDPVLEMVELPNEFVMSAGHWLGLGGSEHYMSHICNLERKQTKHPKGYTISKI